MKKIIGALAAATLIAGMFAIPAMAGSHGDRGAPDITTGNPQEGCPDGMEEVAKYEWELVRDLDASEPFEYVAEHGGDVVTIVDGDEGFAEWSSTTPINAVVLFGGTDNKTYLYDPAVTEGTVNNADMENPGGETPEISNIRFCAGEPENGNGEEPNGEEPNGEEPPTEEPNGEEPPTEEPEEEPEDEEEDEDEEEPIREVEPAESVEAEPTFTG